MSENTKMQVNAPCLFQSHTGLRQQPIQNRKPMAVTAKGHDLRSAGPHASSSYQDIKVQVAE